MKEPAKHLDGIHAHLLTALCSFAFEHHFALDSSVAIYSGSEELANLMLSILSYTTSQIDLIRSCLPRHSKD